MEVSHRCKLSSLLTTLLSYLICWHILLTCSVYATSKVKYKVTTYSGGQIPKTSTTQQFGDGFESSMSCLIRTPHMLQTKDGSIFLTDSTYSNIRKIDGKTGIISLIAGQYTSGHFGDNVLAIHASLTSPLGMALSKNESHLYFSSLSNCIRRVDLNSGMINTIIGTCGSVGAYDNDTQPISSNVRLNNPLSVALSEDERYLFIADFQNNRLRKFDFYTGITSLVYGDSSITFVPQDIIVSGNYMYVSEGIRNVVSIIDWTNNTKVGQWNDFQYPYRMFKQGENLYVCEIDGHIVTRFNITSEGREVVVLPGLTTPYSFFIDLYGNKIVSDNVKYIYNYTTIGSRKVIAGNCNTKYFAGFTNGESSVVSTSLSIVPYIITNNAKYILTNDMMLIKQYSNGNASFIAGSGRIDEFAVISEGTLALNSSMGIVSGLVEYDGEVYFSSSRSIMKIEKNTGLYVLVMGEQGGGNGSVYADLTFMSDLLLNGSVLYIAETDKIRKVNLDTLQYETFISNIEPFRLAIDPTDGNLVFIDRSCTIRKVLRNLSLSILAGKGICGDWDKTLSEVPIYNSMQQSDIEYLSNGDLIIAEFLSQTIRKLSNSSTNISTLMSGQSILSNNNYINVDANNNIYVTDFFYRSVRKLTPYCEDGSLLSGGTECLQLGVNVRFEKSIIYTNSIVKVSITFNDNYLSLLSQQSASILLNDNNSSIFLQSFNINGNPTILSIPIVYGGTFTCKVTFFINGSNVYFYSTNHVQVLAHDQVVTESFLQSSSARDIATIASNSDTFSRSSNSSNALNLVTNALLKAQRNTSDLTETVMVTQALNVISSQSSITTNIVSLISKMVTEISSDLSKLGSYSLQATTSHVESTVSNVLNAYSNVLSFGNYNITSTSVIDNMLIVSSRASSIPDSIFMSETDSFVVSVIRNTNSSLIRNGNVTIRTPSELLVDGISIGSVTFLNVENLSTLFSTSTTKLTNNFTKSFKDIDKGSLNIANLIELKYISNGDFANVADLTNPIKLAMSIDDNIMKSIQADDSLTVTCKYFNETTKEWLSNGCRTEIDESEGVVNCYCNHTTTFSSFVEARIVDQLDWYFAIASIVVGCVLITLNFMALIGVLSTRKKTPTKSRGVVPYFALCSLFIELLFSFIIANSVSLSSNSDTASIIRYVSSMISSLFYCLSILNYLILNLRYITFRYVYEIMAKLDETKVDLSSDKKFKRIKFICTSRVLTLMVNLVFALIFIAFYVTFMSLQLTFVISHTEYTSVMAGSLFSFVITMSILICTIYLFDIFMDLSFVQMNTKLSSKDKKVLINPFKNYFLMNDNLAFRREFLFFFMSIVFFVISYGISFSTLNRDNAKSLYVIVIVFDILYNIMLIMSFGGFVSIISVLEFIHSKKSLEKGENGEDFDTDGQLKEILLNSSLCEVFKQFAKTEHSLENVIFWIKIHPVLDSINKGKFPSNSELTKHFQDWKVSFIETNSPLEVNFSHMTKKSFIAIYESVSNDERNDKEVKEVLTDLYCALMMNLDDTFSRFVLTEGFEKMNNLIELKEQMSSTFQLK